MELLIRARVQRLNLWSSNKKERVPYSMQRLMWLTDMEKVFRLRFQGQSREQLPARLKAQHLAFRDQKITLHNFCLMLSKWGEARYYKQGLFWGGPYMAQWSPARDLRCFPLLLKVGFWMKKPFYSSRHLGLVGHTRCSVHLTTVFKILWESEMCFIC